VTLALAILPVTLAPAILPVTLAPAILPVTLAPVILPVTQARRPFARQEQCRAIREQRRRRPRLTQACRPI